MSTTRPPLDTCRSMPPSASAEATVPFPGTHLQPIGGRNTPPPSSRSGLLLGARHQATALDMKPAVLNHHHHHFKVSQQCPGQLPTTGLTPAKRAIYRRFLAKESRRGGAPHRTAHAAGTPTDPGDAKVGRQAGGPRAPMAAADCAPPQPPRRPAAHNGISSHTRKAARPPRFHRSVSLDGAQGPPMTAGPADPASLSRPSIHALSRHSVHERMPFLLRRPPRLALHATLHDAAW
jgi:hypothetical protein